jgi:AbrB family transcriptional regulator, transcriptional pleiotropic regulator of transition state genes
LTQIGKIATIKQTKLSIFDEKEVVGGGEITVMKSTGIVRKVDELGRVVIPIELRRTLDINIKDPLEIYVDNDKVILKKYQPNMACQITGDSSDENLSLANGKIVLSPEGAKQLLEEIESRFK